MGFLQKLFGGAASEPEAPAVNAEGYPFTDAWFTFDDERKYLELERFLGQVGASFAEPKVTRRPNDEVVDLKVKVDGFPVRLRLDRDGLVCSELVLKHRSPLGFVDLNCDPEKKADDEPEADEDFDEEGGGRRLFVGRAVFFDGGEAEAEAAEFHRLPEAFRTGLVEALPRLGVLYFRIRPEEVDVTLRVEPQEMTHPGATLTEIVRWMGAVAKAVGAAGPAPDRRSTPVVKCSYCQAQQFLPASGRCCNCGAPFR